MRLAQALPEARRKPPGERRRNRLEKLFAHFQEAKPRAFPLEAKAEPGRLFGLLDAEGFFLGYARLLLVEGERGLFLTPVAGEVARLEATRLLLPTPALPG